MGTELVISKKYSLIDLPLNILFQILSDLDLYELQNVSKTCKILRSLANESYIYRINSRDNNSQSNKLTKKMAIDVFNILNNSRIAIQQLNLNHNISLIESIRAIQKKYNLDHNPIHLQIKETINKIISKNTEIDNINENYMHNNNDNNNSNNSSDSDSNNNSNNIKLIKPMTPEVSPYIEILQGFEKFALENRDNEIIDEESDNKDEGTPGQSNTSNISQDIESDYSKSPTSSLFSDVTVKLSQNTSIITSIDDIEHSTDTEQHLRSKKSLSQLRSSMKVKDKTALFEMMSNEESIVFDNILTNYNIDLDIVENLPRTNTPTAPSGTKRNISQGYLDVLTRSNDQIDKSYLSKASDTNKINERHLRRKLKAIIKDNNKISYENI
ncbi:hypothetical protein Kpol_529p8 [Vanderwaltozyma polyspora DSM 70294]|uniref:F-box domain-containing protein n=1 Tax=Vanderwaltozyma polyspora (strain ATCC 22028 / DSM 70294 / BCRC 21397 / CBS 2163 / NBRC 10782 / NRRL Y-8283 / UCD 57-17) TaxID=436907 RepID=A7TM61_VANPO|nr:uncharacterized protein Kpol_529p8 [Vanderwaltozyma polyspora DSM 70294]EDO16628.1 hypothetical protein Kpol_529p8 [Vanderwaltozyma polyspora DSM 70294]